MGYYLEDILTGERVPATISRLLKPEILLIDKSKRFDFDWSSQASFEVYGLRMEGSTQVIGVVSIESQPKNLAIEIKLIANDKAHRGSRKRYDRIAGCLIAFTCAKSISLLFDGFVYLKPKTAIVRHYREKYGFCNTGNNLFINAYNSRKLIKEYYDAFEQEGSEDY